MCTRFDSDNSCIRLSCKTARLLCCGSPQLSEATPCTRATFIIQSSFEEDLRGVKALGGPSSQRIFDFKKFVPEIWISENSSGLWLFPGSLRGFPCRIPGQPKKLGKIIRAAKFFVFRDLGHQERQTCCEPWVGTALDLVPTFCAFFLDIDSYSRGCGMPCARMCPCYTWASDI